MASREARQRAIENASALVNSGNLFVTRASPTGDPCTDRLHWDIKRAGRILMYYIEGDGWWHRRALIRVAQAHGELREYHSPTISLAIDDLVRRGLLEAEPPLGKYRVRRPA